MADVRIGSPEWFRDLLLGQLREQRSRIAILDEYYEGEHRLAFATSKFRRAFGGLFDELADNWCELVVDAVEERLDVEGFRFGEGEEADKEAWLIWQSNQMDAMSQMAHLEALINGESYVLVWQENGEPVLTVEHPEQMVVYRDPSRLTSRLAALKAWGDDWGDEHATLYLPDGIYKWTRPSTDNVIGSGWQQREVEGEGWPLANPLGVVPVVPLVNRPRLLKPGESEIAKVIPVQDAVNKLVADLLIASEYQSFRKRWATGIEIPRVVDDEGNEIVDESEMFKKAIDRVWMVEEPDAKFGEFGQVDLAPFVTSIEMFVQHIASQTRTPPHYFYLSGQFPSGESIKSAEAGLVAKATRKQRFYGEGWEEAMRLAFAVKGDARASDPTSEVIWADPEYRTESAHVDAVIKKAQVGVPNQTLWEELGYTPTQVARFEQQRRTQLADESALAAEFSRLLQLPEQPSTQEEQQVGG